MPLVISESLVKIGPVVSEIWVVTNNRQTDRPKLHYYQIEDLIIILMNRLHFSMTQLKKIRLFLVKVGVHCLVFLFPGHRQFQMRLWLFSSN